VSSYNRSLSLGRCSLFMVLDLDISYEGSDKCIDIIMPSAYSGNWLLELMYDVMHLTRH
jgi:hypothetical protein